MGLERDLSIYHRPVSDLFPWPASKEEWKQYHLKPEQVDFFNENGYLPGIKLLDDKQVGILLEELHRIMDPYDPENDLLHEFQSNESIYPDKILFHSLGHWRMTPGFHDVLWNPAFVMAAYQLLGERSVRFWHDQLFCKPARHGGVVAWHQDYSYWTRTVPMQHLTAWVGLDDSTSDNGCLQYIPGSHKWGLLEKPELAGDMDGLRAYLTKEQAAALDQPTAIEMPGGYGSFHHPLMVHGSFDNSSDMPRRAFVLNVFVDGTVSDTNEKLQTGIPVIRKGEKIEGKFFPVLYPKN